MASTKNHQKPPFRAEHMGSLLRPQALIDRRVARDDKLAVDIAQDDSLHRLEGAAVDEIVAMQLDAGFHGVTDGE